MLQMKTNRIINIIAQQSLQFSMDIDQILEIIPKQIYKWSRKDVEVWLTYIQLPQLIPNFKASSIDGKRLLKMNQGTIVFMLAIQSNIIKKKLINWIQYLGASHQYCQQYLKRTQVNTVCKMSRKYSSFDIQLSSNQTFDEQCPSQGGQSQNTILTKQIRPKAPQNPKYTYIAGHQNLQIFKKSENGGKYLSCDQTSITFGRNPNNNFFIVQRDIDPYHCAIVHRQNHHYIICPFRSRGVWIKIPKRLKLPSNSTIEMGQIDFQVYVDDDQTITIIIFGGRYEGTKYQFRGVQKQIIRVGRKSNCDIALPYDTTLSGYHGKFIYDQGWYFQDLQTTNGSWYKIVRQELVTDRMIFRIGKTKYTFQSRIWKNDDCQSVSSRSSQFGTCRQCRNNQKNCYFRPCYHNQFCFQCGNTMDVCTVCNSAIKNIQKIYKL